MKCPKCDVKLELISPIDAKELVIDRCPQCLGFWIDKGELEGMKDVATRIDTKLKGESIKLERPRDWSRLRWAIYCFKDCYFKE